MRIAIYPGSFDPLTNGHLDILKRALKVFDKVILLVAVNPKKKSIFTVEERLKMLKDATQNLKNVEIDATTGLTVIYAKQKNAVALVRGLRAVSDFEYEFQIATANEFIDASIEMVFFMTHINYTFISSSTVVEMFNQDVDIAKLVPNCVIESLKKKFR